MSTTTKTKGKAVVPDAVARLLGACDELLAVCDKLPMSGRSLSDREAEMLIDRVLDVRIDLERSRDK